MSCCFAPEYLQLLQKMAWVVGMVTRKLAAITGIAVITTATGAWIGAYDLTKRVTLSFLNVDKEDYNRFRIAE